MGRTRTARTARILGRDFYDRDPALVARELLGKLLLRPLAGRERLIGRIVEVEAYLSSGDPACHTNRGLTRRNATMFGPPGHAYVYAIHARHCLNAVTEAAGLGSAVLIRAVEPLAGLDAMRRHRGCDGERELTRGPGRLCEAFAIDRELNGLDLTRPERLWIECDGFSVAADSLGVSPRIGISAAQELPLRFFHRGNRFVSGPGKLNAL